MGDYTIFRRPRFCPNARAFGFSKHSVEVGDLVLYREEHVDGTAGHRLGRVLGLANRCPDGSEHKDMLVVLAANDMLTCAYERFVRLADVEEVRAPSRSAFAQWFLSGPMPRPELAMDAVKYGAVNDRAIDRYLRDGELRPTYRNRDKAGDGPGDAPRCPDCQGPTHRCSTGERGCRHCDDHEGCGWSGLVEGP